jgi:PEP-CTERM motif
MRTTITRAMLWVVFSGLLVLLNTGTTRAQVPTFATLDLVGVGNNVTFINAGAGSMLTTVGFSQPVTFKYKVANSYGAAESVINATMTLTADVNGTTQTGTLFGLSLYNQNFQNVTVVITADTPVSGNTNLLTMSTGTTGSMTGQFSQTTGVFSGDTGGSPANVVNYASDFLFFLPGERHAFTFNLNSVTTAGVPGVTLNANNYLNTFTAQATASFSAAGVNVPEPGTMALVGMGIGVMGVFVRRRRQA